jgi:hypothetical protein
MRHDWKDEQTDAGRDDIGFGIAEESNVPTVPAAPAVPNPPQYDLKTAQVAKVKAAASKSVKLAVLLLGDKVSEDVIEMQARDFMRLGNEALDRALKRFSESEELYVAADEDEDDDDSDEKEASVSVAADEDEGDDDADEKEASAIAADDNGDDDDDDDDNGDKEASEVEAGKKNMDDDDEEDDSDDEKEASEAPKSSGVAELDIELSAGSDETIEPNQSDDLLASLYDEPAAPKQASEKKGAKSIGGQPKMPTASSKTEKGSSSLEALWGETPDVSGVFEETKTGGIRKWHLRF